MLRARRGGARGLRGAATRLAHVANRLAPAASADERAEIARLLAGPEPVIPLFQPVVQLSTGAVAGYEALARFPAHPDRPVPSLFAQARRSDLGDALEAAAIRAALRSGGARPGGAWLALNVSPSALGSPAVAHALPDDLSDIVLEVTEQELVSDDDRVEDLLARLRRRGPRIALDDAGSAYSGLQHIVRMRPEIIKLDRVLVAGVRSRPDKAALIECLVTFARRTSALVCAEGIESLEDLETLAGLGVDYGQGFALARPERPWAQVRYSARKSSSRALKATGRSI